MASGRDPRPVVYVTEAATRELLNAAAVAHPLETGGILIGVRASGRPCIVTAPELPTSDRSESHYRVPSGQTRKTVIAARLKDPRVGYLGEWHSHPVDAGPSPQDRGAMRALSGVSSSPLLVVVRRGASGDYLDIWQSRFFSLQSRRLVLVGEIPAG